MASIYDGIAELADDAVGSVKRGAGVALREVARVAKEHGVSADAVRSYGEQLVNENPQQVTSFADAPGTSAVEGIAGSLPALGAHLAGAAAGARAGRAIGGGKGAIAGGILGGLAPDFVQSYGGNLERQDETGQHNAGTAAIAAVGQAALNQVNPIPAARALRIPGVPASIANIEHPLLDAAGHALGFGLAGAATEPAQEALTRAAAGQSITDTDALNAYKEAAIQGGIAGGVIGGVSRTTENILEGQRQRAREVEQRNADLKASQQTGKPAKPQPEEAPYSPPDLNELSPTERARLDRAINPAPLEVDPAKGAISKAVARGANDGAVEGVTVKKPEPLLPVLDDAVAKGTEPVDESQIVNPIKRDATKEEKVAALRRLTDENKPIVDDFLASIDRDLGTQSKSNVKTDESILNKASRPSILEEKPWHDVEHIRDSFRFKSVLKSPADLEPIVNKLKSSGFTIVKNDLGKLTQPKQWGWRAGVLDLRAPNGQLMEYYMPMKNMEAAKGEGGNHLLFEKWRQRDINTLTPEDRSAYIADVQKSRELYDRSHAQDLEAAGWDESQLRASVDKLSASVPVTASKSSSLASDIPAGGLSDQVPLTRNSQTSPIPAKTMAPLGDLDTTTGVVTTRSPINDGGIVPRDSTEGNLAGVRASVPQDAAFSSIKEKTDGEPDTTAATARGAVPAAGSEALRFDGGIRRGSGRMEQPDRSAVAPVAGLPRKLTVAGRPIEAGPHVAAHDVAREYARGAGIPYRRPAKYVKVDEARATKVAQAFEAMKHAPNDPEVKAAYSKLIEETQQQWEAIKKSGLKVEFIKPGQPDPYARSPRLMTEDVRDNNHMWVFPTDAGFGGESSGHVDTSGNPLNVRTGEVIDGKSVVANDIFRIVHDYFGHVKEGYGFRADGEENAYQSHALMYSPIARRALTTETRGQNSWVNYGPFAEKNRTANGAETEYAPQKIGLLPKEFTDEHIGFEGEEANAEATATEQALRAAATAAASGDARASLGRDSGRSGGPRSKEQDGQLGPSWAPLPRVPARGFVAGKRQRDAVSAVAVHYSSRADLTTLDPTQAGTGSAGQERRRFGAGRFGERGGNSARMYFYVQDSEARPAKESAVSGNNAYRVRLDNLYDAVSDPRGFREEAGLNADYFEELVQEGGFDGFMAPSPGGGIESPVAITFGFKKPIPVERASIGATSSRGLDPAQVQQLADRQTKNWKSGPTVEVVPNHAALPEAIRSILPKNADGAYDGAGKIYLISDRLGSARDVRRVIAHEAYAHYGVKGILGDKFDEFYQRVQSLKDTDEDIRRAYESVNKRYSGLEPHEMADEVVAHLAENYSTLKGRAKIVLAQVIASVKRFLSDKLNIKQDWSANDVLSMIAKSKRALEKDGDARASMQEKARASLIEQTKTPEFKKWFGESKVVDEKGEPKVVYHGTAGEFHVFDANAAASHIPIKGFFFSPDRAVADQFSEGAAHRKKLQGAKPRVISAHLSIKNPARLSYSDRQSGVMTSERTVREDLAEARRSGYDGAIITGWADGSGDTQYVAFRSNQIKSATENNGEFDASNPDIRASVEPTTPDQTQTPAFRKWFGASKITDDEGNPRVVYHGSQERGIDSFNPNIEAVRPRTGPAGTYFTSDPGNAYNYAQVRKAAREAKGYRYGDVVSAYLSIKNPLDITNDVASARARGATFGDAKREALTKLLPEHDGIVFHGDGVAHDEFIAFKPEQIKHATQNSGAFDPASASIRASVPAQAESFDGWTRPSDRLSDYLTNGAKERIAAYAKVAGQKGDQIRTVFQDYFTPVKRVQQAIEKGGGTIAEDADVYGREELYHGRTGERLRKLEDEHVKPLLQQMAKDGASLDDLELYLYAKFAPERNARIAAINEKLPDGGSGMTNADAEKVLKDFEANGQSKKLEALADRVYAMNEVRVKALEDAGLIGKEEAKAWREDKHYVPLKGFAEGVNGDKVQRPPIGSGFSVGGKEAWRALGRRSRATDILANIVSQTDQAIIRAEKNRVAQALLKLVRENPNDSLWTVDKTVNKPGFDRATGEVKYSNRPEPDAIIAKVDGEEHRINISDPQLRDAIKNMGAAKVGAILRGFSSINRFLSLTRTTLAPEFALANMSRDLQEATVNLTGKVGPGAAARAVADVPSAIKAMWGQLGGKKVGGEWARWAQEFADAGGMTSFVAQRTVEEAQTRLEGLLKQANGGVVGNARKLITTTGDFIEQANNTIENATRLSAYVQGRRAGMSTEQAARLAKNLTVNFNRKGSAGAAINALWLFYNASIQGSARFLHAIKSPRVQAMMGGIAATGFALSYYNRVIAGKDDDGEDLWDKVPDYEKQRNLIVMNAFGKGTHLKIPMPYTYNLPYLLGAEMADMVHGKKKPSTAAANMVNSIVGSFNPIGDYDIKKDPTEQGVKLFSPTALQPFLDLAFNRNHFDSPITPEDNPYAKTKTPDSQKFFPSTNPGAVWLADQLNSLTGGNKVRPGAIDISPASMTYLFDYLTGGTGSFVDRAGTAAALALRGEEVPIGKVPFARVFAGSLDDRRVNDTFYQARDDINAKAELGKLIAKPGGLPDASPTDHKDARLGLALAAPLRDIERRMKPVNEAIKLARAKGDEAKLKTLQAAQRTLMLQFNRAYFRVKEQMQD